MCLNAICRETSRNMHVRICAGNMIPASNDRKYDLILKYFIVEYRVESRFKEDGYVNYTV